MAPKARSLNLATTAGIVLHEALRQLRTGHQETRASSKKKTPMEQEAALVTVLMNALSKAPTFCQAPTFCLSL
jgi:tRNA C32,U32 (ribose-2'-O)-methylase TrmJ